MANVNAIEVSSSSSLIGEAEEAFKKAKETVIAPVKSDEVAPLVEKEVQDAPAADSTPMKLEGEVSHEGALHTETGHAQEQHAEGGLPQMDVSSYSSQLFWFFITFTVLYLLMARAVLPRIHEVLEKRRHRLQHDLDQASTMSREAEEDKQSYEKLHSESRLQSSSIIADAYKEIKTMQDAENAKLDAEVASKLADAERDISKSVADVKGKLEPVALELAEAVVKQITGKKPTAAAIKDVASKVKW